MSAFDHVVYYSPAFSRGSQGVTYGQDNIDGAIHEALKLLKAGKQIGEQKFPRAYNAYPHINFTHAKTPAFEFPILKDRVYDGKVSAGQDRVTFGSVSKDFKSANYIGVFVASADDGGRYVYTDLSVNSKGGAGEPFTAKELAEHGGQELLPPPEINVVEAAQLKNIKFQD